MGLTRTEHVPEGFKMLIGGQSCGDCLRAVGCDLVRVHLEPSQGAVVLQEAAENRGARVFQVVPI